MTLELTKWFVDPSKSTISFKVDPKIFAAVEGAFRIFDAEIVTTDNDFSKTKVNLQIDASSITTGDVERDEHLKSADFFDVENHKKITFTSRIVTSTSVDGNYELRGSLTIKGITKEVVVEAQSGEHLKDANGDDNIAFTITANVNRKDWGLLWNESSNAGGLMESEAVHIFCKITLTNNKEFKAIQEVTIQNI